MTDTPVSKEEVRLLAIELNGVRKAARHIAQQNNWNQQQTERFEDRVCQWSKRDKWFPEHQNKAVVSSVSKVSDMLLDELAENERETRLSLSRYARRAAKDSEVASLRDAPYVKQAAQTAAIVHKWGENDKQGQQFTLNVLNINSLQIDDEQ